MAGWRETKAIIEAPVSTAAVYEPKADNGGDLCAVRDVKLGSAGRQQGGDMDGQQTHCTDVHSASPMIDIQNRCHSITQQHQTDVSLEPSLDE